MKAKEEEDEKEEDNMQWEGFEPSIFGRKPSVEPLHHGVQNRLIVASKLGNLEDLPYRRFTGKLPVKIILPVKIGKIWM